MPRYPLLGISKLSQLNIDADKDWNTKGIVNIKQLAAAMDVGDLLVRGAGGYLVRLAPGTANLVLTSSGPGALPTWQPGGTYLNRYFPFTIYLNDPAVSVIAAPDKTISKNASLTRDYKKAYTDDPANYIKRLLATIASTDAQNVIAAADHSIAKNGPLACSIEVLVDGFVEETAVGAQTDKTAEARSGTADDINLPPFTAVNDKIYIGSAWPFWQAWVNVTTNGSGNWVNSCYYWNGAWTACVDEGGDADFQAGARWIRVQHTPQGDWALSVIQGMNLYWMKIETTAWVSEAVAPLGGQIFIAIA